MNISFENTNLCVVSFVLLHFKQHWCTKMHIYANLTINLFLKCILQILWDCKLLEGANSLRDSVMSSAQQVFFKWNWPFYKKNKIIRSSASTSNDKWNYAVTHLKKALRYGEYRETSGCSVCPRVNINVTINFVLNLLMTFQ